MRPLKCLRNNSTPRSPSINAASSKTLTEPPETRRHIPIIELPDGADHISSETAPFSSPSQCPDIQANFSTALLSAARHANAVHRTRIDSLPQVSMRSRVTDSRRPRLEESDIRVS